MNLPKHRVFVLLAATALLDGLHHAAEAANVRAVALSGEPAPGTSGPEFDGFSAPVLNDAGQTSFVAALTGMGITNSNDRGIWSDGAGQLEPLALEGSRAPGTPDGVVFNDSMHFPVINDVGETTFIGLLRGPGVHPNFPAGMWSGRAGNLRLVVRDRQHPPGTESNGKFGFITALALNDAGRVAFKASILDVDSNVSCCTAGGIWSDVSGNLELLVREGQPAPGAPATHEFANFNFLATALNDAGQVGFHAMLEQTTGAGTNPLHGYWLAAAGNLVPVAVQGNPAPGMPSGVNFGTVGSGSYGSPVLVPQPQVVGLNNAGQMAFHAMLTGSGIDSMNDSAIWSGEAGNLRVVAREGDQASGTESGVVFRSLLPEVVINTEGRTAFVAFLSGPGVDLTNDGSMWSEGHGTLRLVAREGSQAPGTPSGIVFNLLRFDPVLNAAGQIAFAGGVRGSGIDSSNDGAIWATDRAGMLQLIAREGDALEVAPGDFRTIRFLSFEGGSGNEDGQASAFNDRGQLAFHAFFADGSSGIFVSNLVAVPEPATLIVASIAGLAISIFGRRSGNARNGCRGLNYPVRGVAENSI